MGAEHRVLVEMVVLLVCALTACSKVHALDWKPRMREAIRQRIAAQECKSSRM
jgi:hypothetical protein